MELLKLIIAIPNIFLIVFFKHLLRGQAAVTINPSGIARVCVGDDLEFTCNVTGIVLEWVFPNLMLSQREFTRGIAAQGPNEDQTFEVMNNNITYRFRRTSAEGSPVSSMLLISPVSDRYNGTDITCVDVSSPTTESSTTTIIIDSQIQDKVFYDTNTDLRVDLTNSEFEIDVIKVTLEWSSQENSLYSYNVNVNPSIPIIYNGNTSIMLNLSYNTLYNVSVLAGHPCEDSNLIIFNEVFNYSKCEDLPTNVTDNNLIILNYSEPAVIRSIVTFICLPGMELKNATCMENGEWKPQLSCTRMMTKVGLQDSASISTLLASIFGIIAFVILIITAALVLYVALYFSIRRAKRTRSKESNGRNSLNESVNSSINGNDQNNSESKRTTAAGGLVYADIGPSSFNQKQHQQLHIPAIDDAPIEYAQIKHESQHNERPSLEKQPTKPTEFKSDIYDSPQLNVNLDNLLIQLRPQVTPLWYQFGEAAGIGKDVLDNFAKQCSPEDCIMEMLDYWLRKQMKLPTWTDVAKILNIIHLPQLALQIENVYVTGKLPVQVDTDWIPQPQIERTDPSNIGTVVTESSLPRIPPKVLELNKSAIHPVVPQLQVDNALPALPPKPNAHYSQS